MDFSIDLNKGFIEGTAELRQVILLTLSNEYSSFFQNHSYGVSLIHLPENRVKDSVVSALERYKNISVSDVDVKSTGIFMKLVVNGNILNYIFDSNELKFSNL